MNKPDPSPAQFEEKIAQLTQRVTELENRSRDDLSGTLRSIVEGTASITGELFFRTLVRYLAKSLDAKYAFLAEFRGSRTRIRTRAVWSGDDWGENFEYELSGTPCEAVLNGEVRHYPDEIQRTFPKNPLLASLQVRSYLAVPLMEPGGEALGHLAIMDIKPRVESETDLSIFHIFAARATAELKRQSIEVELVTSNTEQQRIEAEASYLRDELKSIQEDQIVGSSPTLRQVVEQIDLVAPTDSTVLILGESGTGKELVAREIHRRSRRSARPLVLVNCAALPGTLLESELFGHKKGAFTGATSERVGRFELADRGTIFLDEVAELPLAGQAQLLRVLQEGELQRVGESDTRHVDVRVIAATNRDLRARVEDDLFREDVFYRLNVFPVSVPPLRERLEDLPDLVSHFVERFRRRSGRQELMVSDEVLAELSHYNWPGNIRELQNVVERAVILSTADKLTLPPHALSKRNTASPAHFLSLAEQEKQHILDALKRSDGVVSGAKGAAALLDIHPNTLRSRMQKLGIRSTDESER
ncbi:MAG: sigma 54-interacting transcriptional regulator [Planctomycetota bacterium]